MKGFQNFQEEMFYEAMDNTSKESCASVDTNMSVAGEGSSDRDSLDVLQSEKESLLSLLDVVSPHQRNRRTQALMSLLQEEAQENNITPSHLLGHKENYVKDRAVARVER